MEERIFKPGQRVRVVKPDPTLPMKFPKQGVKVGMVGTVKGPYPPPQDAKFFYPGTWYEVHLDDVGPRRGHWSWIEPLDDDPASLTGNAAKDVVEAMKFALRHNIKVVPMKEPA